MIEISNYIQAFPRDFLFMTSYVWPPARLKGSGVARNQSKCCAVFRLHYRWLWWAQKPISSHKLGQLGREKSAVLPPEIEELKPQNGHETKVNWLIPKSLFILFRCFSGWISGIHPASEKLTGTWGLCTRWISGGWTSVWIRPLTDFEQLRVHKAPQNGWNKVVWCIYPLDL